MKKIIAFILIAVFAFPLAGYAATAPQTTPKQPVTSETSDSSVTILPEQSLAAQKKIVENNLRDMLTRLNKLSLQTQLTINQLAGNGITTDASQTALATANKNLLKAKLDVDAFAGITVSPAKSAALTLTTLKYTANTAENTLQEAKVHIIESLTALKAALITPDTTVSQ